MPVDIIIIAAIAIFVLLRLRNVLGQKNDSDKTHENMMNSIKQEQEKVVQLYKKHLETENGITGGEQDDAQNAEETLAVEALDDNLGKSIEKIRKLNPDFRVTEFLSGAKMAFDMVLVAFEKGDKSTLKQLLSSNVYQQFDAALDDRDKSDEREEITLVSIGDIKPVSIDVVKNKVVIKTTIISEQMIVVKNKDGEVIGGDAKNIITVEDEWSFEKDVKSPNPNWKIIAT